MKARHFIIPAYLLVCIMLGGASLAGYKANLALQLLALPILVAAFLNRPHGQPATAKALQWLAASLFILMGLQLIPLPPGLWTALPGREQVAAGFEMIGEPLPWLPWSLAPDETLADALWLLPAAAILFGVLRLGAFRPHLIAWTIAAATFVAVMFGALQVGGGENSAFYFYQITNRGQAVGPFANANHMATLLLIAIPFLFALIGRARGKRRSQGQTGIITLCVVLLALVVVGLGMSTSLAGIGLSVPVTLASLVLLRKKQDVPVWALGLVGVISVAAVATVFLLPIGNSLFGDNASSAQSRVVSIGTTLEAAKEHLPLGSGFGTFADIYKTHENPATITQTWMNHAHSDYAEILLEGGIPAALLILVFLFWWVRRAGGVWSAGEDGSLFAKAATIASAAALLHSLVDYPLRTAAIAGLFAACLGLMTGARASATPRRANEDGDEVRHLTA